MKNRCLILSLAVLGFCLFIPQKSTAQSAESIVSCSSDDMGRHSCSVDVRGGVRLTRQHSEAACTEAYSWGTDERGIWVDHGCRADFAVGDYRSDQDPNAAYRDANLDIRDNNRNRQDDRNRQTISCNSDDERRNSCSFDTRGGVHLLAQHSAAACTEGYSWGSDERGIWVDHGCRADFTVGRGTIFQDQSEPYRDVNHDGRDDRNRHDDRIGQTVACSSNDMHKHNCRVETRGAEVRLVTQHSDSACTKGYSWGTNRRGIWVDHGCRADFVVLTRNHQNSWR